MTELHVAHIVPEPVQAALDHLVGLPIAEVERDLILATLRETGGNRTHAAAILGVAIRTLRNKISAYAAEGHDIPEPPSASAASAGAAAEMDRCEA